MCHCRGKLAILTQGPFSAFGSVFFSDGTDTHTDNYTNRTTGITDKRLNLSKGRFSENQTETYIFSGWLPSVTTRPSNLVLTMMMTMTMMMMMLMAMQWHWQWQWSSSLFTNLVGQDEPVVSLGTYSEFSTWLPYEDKFCLLAWIYGHIHFVNPRSDFS